MIPPSELTNWHLNGILHARLFGDEVKYLGLGKLTDVYIPGSDPVYRDFDDCWSPVPNYAGDYKESQFLRYALAKTYNFIIEPHEGKLSVLVQEKLDGNTYGDITNALELTGERATAVALYIMTEIKTRRFGHVE